MTKLLQNTLGITLLFIMVNIIMFPAQVSQATKQSLTLCLNNVIPSLFPFFVCSSLFSSLGIAHILGRYLRHLTKIAFNVSESGAFVFTMGLIGGCPVGIKTIVDMHRNGECSRHEAERLMAFCNNAGPLFVLGTVGSEILKNAHIGWILYTSQIISAALVGVLFKGWKARQYPIKYDIHKYIAIKPLSLPTAMQQAISSAIIAVISVCGFVVFFSIFTNIMSQLFHNDLTKAIFASIIEMTGGINLIAQTKLSAIFKVATISSILSFCGISIMFQVGSIIEGSGLTLTTYIIGKIIQAAFSFVITYAICFVTNIRAI